MSRVRKRFKGKRLGHYLMTCDLSGHVGWDDEMVETWDGLWVLKEYFEERHPQDFVRGTNEDWSVPVSRPQPEVSELCEPIYEYGVFDYNDFIFMRCADQEN